MAGLKKKPRNSFSLCSSFPRPLLHLEEKYFLTQTNVVFKMD